MNNSDQTVSVLTIEDSMSEDNSSDLSSGSSNSEELSSTHATPWADDEARAPTDKRLNPCCAMLHKIHEAKNDMVQMRAQFSTLFSEELRDLKTKKALAFFTRRAADNRHRTVGFYQDHMCRYICLACYARLVVLVQVEFFTTAKSTAVRFMLPEFCSRFIQRAYSLSSLDVARELFWYNNKKQVAANHPEWSAELDQQLFPVIRDAK